MTAAQHHQQQHPSGPRAQQSRIARLRQLLRSDDNDDDGNNNQILLMPCCYDALSARLVERAGFHLTFMSGFATAAARALPDTGLLSYGEMRDQIASITDTLAIPLIADADAGYGNAVNARRTVLGYAAAGAAGLLIEDQVAPKRCGHTRGKAVVPRDEAIARVQAAVDARHEADSGDGGPVIIARTDAGRDDFEEALERARAFHRIGADVTFVEAPRTADELRRYADEVPGLKLANMLEQGDTPILPPADLQKLGFKIAAYPLTLLSASVKAQEIALARLMEGNPANVQPLLKDFKDLREIVGFDEYYRLEDKYSTSS
jgi:2-methylisocitrate lyase-like PEP mutase family enzyme